MTSFLYSARNRSGKPITDRVPAQSLIDARSSLEQLGFTDIKFHTDEAAEKLNAALRVQMGDDTGLDEQLTPGMEKESRDFVGFWRSIWFGIKANWTPWLVLLLWNGITLYKGPPYRRLGWTGFILGILFLAFFVLMQVPSIAFNNLLEASVWCRNNSVRRSIRILRAFRRCTGLGVPAIELDCRLAVVMAREGDLAGAIALYGKHENNPLGRAYFLSRQGDIFEAAKDDRGCVECHRKAFEASGGSELNPRIDYALALVRNLRNAEAADQLMKEVSEEGLAEMPKAFVFWIRGLIALERNQFPLAEKYFRDTLALQRAAASNPIAFGIIMEVKATLCIAVARQCRMPEAKALLKECSPLLRARKETELLARCEAAIKGY